MKAGRELDALVAEKVTGFQIVVTGYEMSDYRQGRMPGEQMLRSLPAYSTDIAAAWEVVAAMDAKGLVLYLDGTDTSEWAARFYDPNRVAEPADADAFSAPLGICLAALAAVGAEVPA